MKLNNWERLESVIVWANMTVNAFAHHLGMERAENLYQIKRGSYGISMRLASRIVEKFPEIDKLWLLTGEGEMLRRDEVRTVVVPFYDEDVCRSVEAVGYLTPYSEIVVPDWVKCDFAMRCDAGAADMAGTAASGAASTTIVLLRRCAGEAPAAGEYVAVRDGAGELLRVDGTDAGAAADSGIVCEVVGRIVLKRPTER